MGFRRLTMSESHAAGSSSIAGSDLSTSSRTESMGVLLAGIARRDTASPARAYASLTQQETAVNDGKLGSLITDTQSRDAIHIAVAPATAAERLQPGQHVGFVVAGSTALVGSDAEPYVGIVDPFLMAPVEEGQRFWLCLYPQTVTGMR